MMTDTVEINPEDVTVSIWPTVWIYSLLIAVCVFAYKVVLYAYGLAGDSFGQGLITDLVIIVLVFLGLRNYRRLNNGYMTYGMAAQLGVTISIISTILRSALYTLYLTFVGSSVLPAMREETLNTVQSSPVIN